MPEPEGGLAPVPPRSRRRAIPWRRVLRASHRDLGYLAVGLTLTYAVSGIAVNHVADWDPSFESFERTYQLETPLPADDAAIAQQALAAAGVATAPEDVYRASDTRVDITVSEEHAVHVQTDTGVVVSSGRTGRPILRGINWLHLNRGKAAWTAFSDAFAAMLILLALSGMFMIKGRKGLVGRGAVLVTLGLLVPIGYLWLSGGP